MTVRPPVLYWFKQRWLLFLNLLVFVIFKFQHLFYPYFFDESWWYYPAVKLMYTHGPSLLPTAIDPEYSRGHPLLFHCLYAIWMRFFGTSHFSMHSFALIISLCVLFAVYEIGLKLFNLRVAAISTFLVSTQVVFFVQASYVLPEILVALFILLSLHYYSSRRMLLTSIFLFLALFTKESALIAAAVLGIDAFVGLFRPDRKVMENVQSFFVVSAPVILIAVFFLLQKQAYGWLIHPVHSGLIDLSWDTFFTKFSNNAFYLLVYDYRVWLNIILLIFPIVAAIQHRSMKYIYWLLVPFLIIFIFFYRHDVVDSIGHKIYFLIILFSGVFLIGGLSKFTYFFGHAKSTFIRVSLSFIFCYAIYCSLSFITYRYLVSSLVPMLILSAVFIDFFINSTRNFVAWPIYIVLGTVFIMSYKFNTEQTAGDSSLESFHTMTVHQKTIEYCEQHQLYEKDIDACSSHLYNSLRDEKFGNLNKGRRFTRVTLRTGNREAEYTLVDNIDSFYSYNTIKNDTGRRLVFRAKSGNEWAEIYTRKPH